MGGRAWSQEDLNRLEELTEKYPLATVARILNRSENAVFLKRQRLGIGGFMANTDMLTRNTLSRILGVENRTIQYWERKGLKSVRKNPYVMYRQQDIIRYMKEHAGFKLAECLIWEKNSFVLGRQDYQWRHEPILYGWKEGAAHYFIDDRSQDTILLEDELDLESMKKEDLITYINQIIAQYKDQTTVLFEKKPTKNDVHPTMKPVNLVGRLMRNSSKPGWNVLDLFGGSGSTLMAAEQIGRRAFLMELDEKFCDVIVHRWEEFTGKKAVRAGKLEVSL